MFWEDKRLCKGMDSCKSLFPLWENEKCDEAGSWGERVVWAERCGQNGKLSLCYKGLRNRIGV